MDYEFISLVVLVIGFAVLWVKAEMRVADLMDELFDMKRGGYGRTL